METENRFRDLVETLERSGDDLRRPDSFFAVCVNAIESAVQRAGAEGLVKDAVAVLSESTNLPRGTSHRHPIGFEKIGLYRSERSGIQVRLHVWPGGQADEDPHEPLIHDHRWNFVSCVLVGKIVLQNFAVSMESGEGTRCYDVTRLSDAIDGTRKTAHHAGSTCLRVSSAYHLAAPAIHCLSYDQPHLALPSSNTHPALSLVITAAPARDHSFQYIEPSRVRAAPPPLERMIARSLYDRAEAVRILVAALNNGV